MAGAYDGTRKPDASHDPLKEIQWQIQKQVLQLWQKIVQAIQTAIETVTEWATKFFDAIFNALVGLDADEVLALLVTDPLGFIPKMIARLINQGLLGVKSALNAFNIYGLLQSWNIPFLSLSAIGQTHPNLLVQPGFDAEDSIELADGWDWSPTEGRTKPGCAHTIASPFGIERAMVSIPIPVGAGQVVYASTWAKWTGLVYAGTNPITVDLIRYDENMVELSRTTLQSITSPATSQLAWYQFDCPEYEIPDDGTAQIRLQFRVRSNATAGQFWFDDAVLKKTKTQLPQNWILNLVPDLGGIRNWIQDLIDGIISAIRGIPFVGGTLAHILLYITGWKEDTDHAAGQASDAYIGLNVTQKVMIATAQGIPVDPSLVMTAQDIEVNAALLQQTETIVSQGADIEAIKSQLTETSTNGIRVLDDFERTDTGDMDPTKWQKYILEGTSPAMETINGHDASMTGADGTVMYRWIGQGSHTTTPRQKVTVSIAERLTYPGIGDGRRSQHAAYCRVSDDGTKWVRVYWDNVNRLVVDYRNGGVTGQLYNSGADGPKNPGPGSALAIEPGVGSDEYSYRIWRGNTPLMVVTDPTHATDITQLGHGMGMRRNSGYGPGRYTQYTAVDTAQAAIVGSYLQVCRLATGSTNVAAGANIGVYDSITRSQDITFDLPTQVATITKSGLYAVTIRMKASSRIPRDDTVPETMSLLVSDGVSTFESPSSIPMTNPIVGGTITGGGNVYNSTPGSLNAIWGMWLYPMNAGNTVKGKLRESATTFACVGTADGLDTYMTIAKVA